MNSTLHQSGGADCRPNFPGPALCHYLCCQLSRVRIVLPPFSFDPFPSAYSSALAQAQHPRANEIYLQTGPTIRHGQLFAVCHNFPLQAVGDFLLQAQLQIPFLFKSPAVPC